MGRSITQKDERAAVMRRRLLGPAVVVFVLGLALRVVYVLELRSSPLADFPVLDELYHVEWARALAAGNWIGDAVFFRAPLYPYLLGVVFSALGENLLAARLVQAVVGALACPAVYALGRRLFGGREARLAAAVAALYPFLIYYANELLIVTLAVLLDLLLLLALLRADELPSRRRWFAAGVVAGLSAIARPNVLVFLPGVFLWMWWRARTGREREEDTRVRERSGGTAGGPHGGRKARGRAGFRTAAARFALVLLGTSVAVVPVTLRNYYVGRDFVPIASQGGINFFIGNNSSSDGASAVLPVLGESWQNEDAERIAQAHAGRELKPSEVSAFWYARGREFILGRPGAAARLFLRKLVLFWDRYELANNKDVYFFGNMSVVFRSLAWLNFGLVAPLALVGMFLTVRRNPGAALAAVFVVSYMAGILLFFVNARFRLPVVPVLMVFAAAGALRLVRYAVRGDVRRLTPALLALAAAALFVNYDFYGTHLGDRAQTHMTLGRASAARGRAEEAIREYRRAIELSPGYAKAYNSMGLSLEALGRDDDALEAYLKAAELDTTLASVRNNIGSLHLRRGDVQTAKEWFERALDLDEYLEQAHMNLAMVLAQEGDLPGAEYHLRAAVTANPEFKEAWDALGRVLEETGRLGEAAGINVSAASACIIEPGEAKDLVNEIIERVKKLRGGGE